MNESLPEITPEIEMEWLRNRRNQLLLECDWTQGADVPDSIKLAWQPYREALRNITDTYTTLGNVVWPDKP